MKNPKNKFFRNFIIAVVIPTIIITAFNSLVFAVNISHEVVNISYWLV